MKETSYETDIMLELKDDDVLDQGVYSESGKGKQITEVFMKQN